MTRIKVPLPAAFPFTCTIAVRVTDINYGGHVGNDALLGMIHEARVQFLRRMGYTELSMEGVGLIMADAAIEFKNEVFMEDSLQVSVAAGDFQRVGFDLYYRIEKVIDGKKIPVVFAKTGMICFDYSQRKITQTPEAALQKLKQFASNTP
ncbi:thioesterase family protein [Niabella sp. CC-SYL272]|uniref:acyl-CoA thioesterase n=1 Tax=Niabella agricola TaxID=2891571 RepID=UPI001F18A19A|nr:thioesterase family protein [Niabella agricola]MCF3111737.1 thioesterase family protein [Niabella agricola]